MALPAVGRCGNRARRDRFVSGHDLGRAVKRPREAPSLLPQAAFAVLIRNLSRPWEWLIVEKSKVLS